MTVCRVFLPDIYNWKKNVYIYVCVYVCVCLFQQLWLINIKLRKYSKHIHKWIRTKKSNKPVLVQT